MNQSARRQILIRSLLNERPEYQKIEIPHSSGEQKNLLRSLMNLRPPRPLDPAFLTVQDALLTAEAAEKGMVDGAALPPPPPAPA